MEIPEMAPVDVAARLETAEKAVYLDVRSEREFEQGHPEGALNIPIFHFDPPNGRPQPNNQFLAVVNGTIDKDTSIYVGCASGQRSYQAASLMKSAGYDVVVNVDGGFSGKRDPSGTLAQAGWVECGLPVGTGDGGERSYSTLLEVAADNQENE